MWAYEVAVKYNIFNPNFSAFIRLYCMNAIAWRWFYYIGLQYGSTYFTYIRTYSADCHFTLPLYRFVIVYYLSIYYKILYSHVFLLLEDCELLTETSMYAIKPISIHSHRHNSCLYTFKSIGSDDSNDTFAIFLVYFVFLWNHFILLVYLNFVFYISDDGHIAETCSSSLYIYIYIYIYEF